MNPIIHKANDKVNIVINQAEGIINNGKCPQCGASFDEGAKFCKFCGTAAPDNTIRAEITIDDKNAAQAAKFQHDIDKRQSQIEMVKQQRIAIVEKAKAQREKEEARLAKEKAKSDRFTRRLVKSVLFLMLVPILVILVQALINTFK